MASPPTTATGVPYLVKMQSDYSKLIRQIQGEREEAKRTAAADRSQGQGGARAE
jgi:hypothetical protein